MNGAGNLYSGTDMNTTTAAYAFLTPAERHAGNGTSILGKRHEVYEAAKKLHPERWNSRDTRDWSDIKEVYLNPDNNYEEFNAGTDDQNDTDTKESA